MGTPEMRETIRCDGPSSREDASTGDAAEPDYPLHTTTFLDCPHDHIIRRFNAVSPAVLLSASGHSSAGGCTR
jgi:hypothetical protein